MSSSPRSSFSLNSPWRWRLRIPSRGFWFQSCDVLHGTFQMWYVKLVMLLTKAGLEKSHPPGVHLATFWSGTCHRGCKSIPVPYTNFSKKYTRTPIFRKCIPNLIPIIRKSIPDQIFYTKVLKIDTVHDTKLMKLIPFLILNIWKINTLPVGTYPYPKYMTCPPWHEGWEKTLLLGMVAGIEAGADPK